MKEGERDITWLTPDARQMRSADWTDRADTLGFLLARKELTGRVLVYVYRQEGEKTLKLPLGDWTCILKTEEDKPDRPFECGETLTVTGPGVAVLCEKCEHLPRRSGLIMHVTSLAGPFGSGDFGKGARDFIDWMKRGNQKLWQVLPLTVAGEGNSPYMGESVFAGNELLIDLATLVRERLLLPSELAVKEPFDEEKVDFVRVTAFRIDRLKRAAFRFFSQKTLPEAFGKFVWQERYWLEDYALFKAIKTEQAAFGRRKWQDWPEALRRRNPEALKKASMRLMPFLRKAPMCGRIPNYSYWMNSAIPRPFPVFRPITSVPRDSFGVIPFTTGPRMKKRAMRGGRRAFRVQPICMTSSVSITSEALMPTGRYRHALEPRFTDTGKRVPGKNPLSAS